VEVPEPFTENIDGETTDRRSGKPFTNAYKQFRTQLFLTNLSQVQAESSLNPSVLFVQRNFLNAFFGWTPSSGQDVAPSTAPIPLFEICIVTVRVLTVCFNVRCATFIPLWIGASQVPPVHFAVGCWPTPSGILSGIRLIQSVNQEKKANFLHDMVELAYQFTDGFSHG
jgi:hypothetical protein